MNDTDQATGYRKPPAATRFKKGQSGNPKGRPRGRHRDLPYEAVLGQIVSVREDGLERRITAAEAFLLHITKRGLEGDGGATRSALKVIEEARAAQIVNAGSDITRIILALVAPGSVEHAAKHLRIVKKLDPYRPTTRLLLEPWVVEAALARLGDRTLTIAEQRTVLKSTQTPKKVTWPSWWTALP